MSKNVIMSSVLLAFLSLTGCMTKPDKPVEQTSLTRDQVLNKENYYIPTNLEKTITVPNEDMKMLDVVKLIEKQTGYTFQIYDRGVVENLRVNFDEKEIESIKAMDVLRKIDKQYTNKLEIHVYEAQQYIEIKNIQ